MTAKLGATVLMLNISSRYCLHTPFSLLLTDDSHLPGFRLTIAVLLLIV
jgi:hypothetical protein